MIRVFLLYILLAPVLGLERNCLQQNIIDKSREGHPKYGINCNRDIQIEDRWRGELIYEKLEGDLGIKIKWKLLVQKPDCPAELKFFVNNRELKSISPRKSKSHNSDWIELTAMENFELKVQALYYTDPKCIEATKIIILKDKVTPRPTSTTPALQIVSKKDKTSFTLFNLSYYLHLMKMGQW